MLFLDSGRRKWIHTSIIMEYAAVVNWISYNLLTLDYFYREDGDPDINPLSGMYCDRDASTGGIYSSSTTSTTRIRLYQVPGISCRTYETALRTDSVIVRNEKRAVDLHFWPHAGCPWWPVESPPRAPRVASRQPRRLAPWLILACGILRREQREGSYERFMAHNGEREEPSHKN